MRQALPEETFVLARSLIHSKIGDYVSKEFFKTESQNQYTAVIYKARFTQETEDVIVRVVFQETEDVVRIAGLWFDSPKLRQQ